jgi:triosephosphate isomerase
MVGYMKILVANWKMNPNNLDEARQLFRDSLLIAETYPTTEIVVCPPFPYIEECASLLAQSGIANLVLGAQDVFWKDKGAYTGEVSAKMLREFGVRYVILGHSDRRTILGETNDMIHDKIAATLGEHMIPLLLVGEQQRDEVQEDILIDQISGALRDMTSIDIAKILFVYEPGWAISTKVGGGADDLGHIITSCIFIQKIVQKIVNDPTVQPSLLYGGSVNSQNVSVILASDVLSGVLIGSASLHKEQFSAIAEIVSHIS